MLTEKCVRVPQRAVGKKYADEQIMAELEQNQVPGPVQSMVVQVLRVREEEIRKALITQASSISNAHLVDFDWSLRLILSSGSISQVRQPVLLLKLYLKQADQTKPQQEFLVELTKPDLERVLTDFSRVQELLQSLTLR